MNEEDEQACHKCGKPHIVCPDCGRCPECGHCIWCPEVQE